MQLMMFRKGSSAALGIVEGRTVIDVAAAEAVLEDGAGEGTVVADRRGGQISFMLQVLREAGRQFIGGR